MLAPCAFVAGHEFNNDAKTVGQLDIRSRQVITCIASPQDNSFTKLPAEYRQEWEQMSLTWMLSNQVCSGSLQQLGHSVGCTQERCLIAVNNSTVDDHKQLTPVVPLPPTCLQRHEKHCIHTSVNLQLLIKFSHG